MNMGASKESISILKSCASRSEAKIEAMRKIACREFGTDSSLVIGVNGSYARREATEGSDVDLFFLTNGNDITSTRRQQERFQSLLESELQMKLPTLGGVFSCPLTMKQIEEIGGQPDNNVTITRRMLLLLEGEWIFNELGFRNMRRKILKRYLHDEPGKDKICMFLLNDIIRYWRTICVDLEHKTYGGGKAREIRLIKLRFSRMLLYVSGIFSVGIGYGLPAEKKMEQLESTFTQYPIERMRDIVGQRLDTVLEIYAEFLEALDDAATRERLESGLSGTEDFEHLTSRARLFRDSLHCMLRRQFPEDGDNPTLRAILL